MKFAFPIAATAALVLAACGSADETAVLADEATATDTLEADAPNAEAALLTTAQGFVDTASGSDMFEVEAGKLAQTNGKSQAVRRLSL